MVETVALSGITETPLVIMMGQRPGPATGMPTWTEQGDLLFVVFSGHGEFPKMVFAPGDMEEAYALTVKAFNVADKYQTPVFILADKYILEGHQSVNRDNISGIKVAVDRGKLLTQEELKKLSSYKRYQDSPDGISPRVVPGMDGSLHQANSYEHLEDGHTTEDALQREKQVNKRNRKADTYLKEDFDMPAVYGPQNAPLTVVSFGSMKAPILQALKDSGGKSFNYLHFTHIFPLDGPKVREKLSEFKKLLLVENNSTAQFGHLLKMSTGMEIENKLLKYSGRPLYPDEIIGKIKELE